MYLPFSPMLDEGPRVLPTKSSTWWGEFLADAGYDRAGRKGGESRLEGS
jgi:hypothetical protein